MQEPFREFNNATIRLTPRPADALASWGGPLSFEVRHRRKAADGLPPPSVVVPKPTASIARRVECAFAEEKCDGGFRPWLLLSTILSYGDYAAAKHDDLLFRHELRCALTPQWFGSSPGLLTWRISGDKSLLRIGGRLDEEWMNSCFLQYGNPRPGGEGHWLAVRLLPRQRPCAIRQPDPFSIQVFVPLFHP